MKTEAERNLGVRSEEYYSAVVIGQNQQEREELKKAEQKLAYVEKRSIILRFLWYCDLEPCEESMF